MNPKFKVGDKVIMYRYMSSSGKEVSPTGKTTIRWIAEKTLLIVNGIENPDSDSSCTYRINEQDREEDDFPAYPSEIRLAKIESWKDAMGGVL